MLRQFGEPMQMIPLAGVVKVKDFPAKARALTLRTFSRASPVRNRGMKYGYAGIDGWPEP